MEVKAVVSRIEWKLAYEKVLGRVRCPFGISFDRACRGYLKDGESASCCSNVRRPSRGFPLSMVRHANTLKHFVTWCLEHKDEAAERFPEVKLLLAEDTILGSGY